MGVVRFAESLGFKFSGMRFGVQSEAKRAPDAPVYKVGDFFIDYGPIPTDEIAKPIPEIDALLARSRLVSEKRGL